MSEISKLLDPRDVLFAVIDHPQTQTTCRREEQGELTISITCSPSAVATTLSVTPRDFEALLRSIIYPLAGTPVGPDDPIFNSSQI